MAAQTPTTTLRQLLTQRKPYVECKSPKPSKNTQSTKWPEIGERVKLWDEFDLATMNEGYAHILDCHILEPLPELPDLDLTFDGLEINTDQDVSRFIGWNHGVMKPTVEFARSVLGLQQGCGLYHSCGTPANGFKARLQGQRSHRLQLSHVVACSTFPAHNLVVGMARASSRWDGLALAACVEEGQAPPGPLLWPLRQLLDICKASKTRYGYIQTDQVLMACRFSKDAGLQWKVAIKPIPVTLYGPNELTADLAIWWMCMMALSSRENSVIVAEEDIVPINAWEEVEIEGKGRFRRHRHSMLEMPLPQVQGGIPEAPVATPIKEEAVQHEVMTPSIVFEDSFLSVPDWSIEDLIDYNMVWEEGGDMGGL